MKPVSRGIDRIAVTFDDPNLVANAGLLLVATLVRRLGLEDSVQRDHPAQSAAPVASSRAARS